MQRLFHESMLLLLSESIQRMVPAISLLVISLHTMQKNRRLCFSLMTHKAQLPTFVELVSFRGKNISLACDSWGLILRKNGNFLIIETRSFLQAAVEVLYQHHYLTSTTIQPSQVDGLTWLRVMSISRTFAPSISISLHFIRSKTISHRLCKALNIARSSAIEIDFQLQNMSSLLGNIHHSLPANVRGSAISISCCCYDSRIIFI